MSFLCNATCSLESLVIIKKKSRLGVTELGALKLQIHPAGLNAISSLTRYPPCRFYSRLFATNLHVPAGNERATKVFRKSGNSNFQEEGARSLGGRVMNVLVYSDEGVSNEALNQTLRTLRSTLSPRYIVNTVTAAALLNSQWESSTSLLVFPGGRDIPYCRSLQTQGTRRIRSYVESGGNYLGICAGAYFASARVVFEPGRPLYEVIGERDLRLVEAEAHGSVYPGFTYNSEAGAQAASLDVCGERFQAYHNGGCSFEFTNGMDSDTEISGWYTDTGLLGNEKKPAILSRTLGKGIVILSGAHLEYFSYNMKQGPEAEGPHTQGAESMLTRLAPTDDIRLKVIRHVLGNIFKLELSGESPRAFVKS